jgi:hypothetical protein
MKLRSMFAFVMLLSLAPLAHAQEAQEVPAAAIQESSGPAYLGAEAPAVTIASDIESGNVMVAGFTLGAAYDNRGLASGTPPTYSGDTRYFVQPSIAFQRKYSTGGWTLSYTPGLSVSQNDTGNNQYTQNLAGELNWKPNARFALHARQDYSLTDNPFETVGRVDLLSGLGGPLGPNYSGVLPQTKRTSLVSNVDFSYLVAEHSAIGLTGGLQKFDYDALNSTGSTAAANPFVNSEVISGSAFFSQQLSPALSAGVQFAYTDIYSRAPQTSRTQAPAPMLFVKWSPIPRTQITLYGGPQYTITREVITLPPPFAPTPVPVFQRTWRATYGGSLAWSGGRHAFDMQAMRRVANGGGVFSAVQDTNAGAGYRWRFTQRLLTDLRLNYSDETGIGIINPGNYFRSLWAGGGPVVSLNRSLALRMDVAYVHQSQLGMGAVAGNHLLVQGSLDYRFHKSLGD